MNKDVIVIGGGPGGYVAAIRAAQLGADVCLIERDKIGGTCLNRGCIPTKTLWKNAEILNTLKRINEFGIQIDSYSINVEEVQNRKQKVVGQLVSGIEQLLKANKVEVVNGAASFKDKNTVSILLADGSIKEVTAKNIIIATGSKPSAFPVPGTDLEGVVSSEEILEFKQIPGTLTIIGGGVIGMEFAGIFNAMGSKVTVIEYLPSILGRVDTDIAKRLLPIMKKKGIEILTSTKLISIERNKEQLTVHCEDKKGACTKESEMVLIAVGRTPNIEGLNIDAAGIEYGAKGIKVNDHFETNVEGIYAIGDVNGKYMLAHAASHQGIQAANSIMKQPVHNSSLIPSCIFLFPEVAGAGLTEDEAKEQGIAYHVSKFLFGANGKALALGETEGFVKVLSSEDDTIIGVHIVGPHASDLIHEGTLAISAKLKAEDIIKTIHAHPTLPEAFHEAVSGLKGEAIHMIQPKR